MNILAELAERSILAAQQRGEFDHLEGQGQPLQLEGDPFVPEHLRMAFKMLKNAGYVPEAILEQREIRSLIECLEEESDESAAMCQIQKLQHFITRSRLRHGGLLLEENEAYFRKVVACITLNRKSHS